MLSRVESDTLAARACLQDAAAEDICWVLGQQQGWVFLSAPRWLMCSAAVGFKESKIPNAGFYDAELQHMSFRRAARRVVLGVPASCQSVGCPRSYSVPQTTSLQACGHALCVSAVMCTCAEAGNDAHQFCTYSCIDRAAAADMVDGAGSHPTAHPSRGCWWLQLCTAMHRIHCSRPPVRTRTAAAVPLAVATSRMRVRPQSRCHHRHACNL